MHTPFDDLAYYKLPDTIKAEDLGDAPIKTLVVVKAADHTQHAELLTKICSAIQFEEKKNGMTIVLEPDQNINLAELHRSLQFKLALVFYVPTKQVGLQIKARRNHVMPTENFSIIYTDTLDKLAQNKDLKMALWQCLKTQVEA